MSSKQQSRSVIACLVAALWFLPLSCLAEGSAPATKQTQAIRADIFDQLSKAQVAQEKGNYAEALKYLDAIRAASSKKPLQPYEEAQLWNFYAYVYLAQEKQESAINAFEKILALPEIPESLALSARYALAQLYLVQGDIKKGIRMLEQWFARATNPAPDAYVMLGQAYLQEKRLDEAQKALLTALEVARQQGKAEKENWYLLLQYVYGEKQQYRKQEEILKILVSRWPKKTYWLSLFGVYSELDNQAGQLNVLETAYVQGFLDQKGYLLTLAQLLAANGMPNKAAKVLEKGLNDKLLEADAETLERTGEYFRLAQETDKAIPYLVRAAKMAKDGKPAMRLAYLYLGIYQYENAAAQIREAMSRGGIQKPLEAQLLLGTALFHAKQFDQAAKVFDGVARSSRDEEGGRWHKQAVQWLEIIEAERKRLEEIKAYTAS